MLAFHANLISRAEAIVVKKRAQKKNTNIRLTTQKGEKRKYLTLLDLYGEIMTESPYHWNYFIFLMKSYGVFIALSFVLCYGLRVG